MVDLTLADGSVLHATDRHPIWDATDRTFTYAIDLHSGEQLQRADGTLLTLAKVVVRQQTLTAYNLTIAGIHTYYAGTTPLLVHNSCEPLPTQKAGQTQPLTTGQASDLAKHLGYQRRNEIVRGERVFSNGKSFIVQDTTSHNGGTWKMAGSVEDLGSKETRGATTDALLNAIGQ